MKSKYESQRENILKNIKKSNSFRSLAKSVGCSSSEAFIKYVKSLNVDLSHFTRSFPGSTKYSGIIGHKYGKLTVLSVERKNKDIKPLYYATCRCECGTVKDILVSNVTLHRTVSCGCIRDYDSIRGNKSKVWKGIGDISGTHLKKIRRQAKERNLPFDLTKEYLWDLFLKQERKCALSGIELHFASDSCFSDTTASLDRIDNSLGYVEGNVQWVHKSVNYMRGQMDIESFVRACRMVSEYYKYVTNDDSGVIPQIYQRLK